jgi:hypothetical protein
MFEGEGLYEGPIIVEQVWEFLTFSVSFITFAVGVWGAWVSHSKGNTMSEEDKKKFRDLTYILFAILAILMFVGMNLFGWTSTGSDYEEPGRGW